MPLRQKVEIVWLLDPVAQTLEVLEHSPGGWVLRHVFNREGIVRARPLEALELELSSLWRA